MKATHDILIETKRALPALAASGEKKNAALKAIASRLLDEKDAILQANALDVEAAKERLGDVMIDRLTLTEARIEGMAQGVLDVAALADPEGRVLRRIERPNGIVIEKTSVPLGVVSIIYESRPNVTSDAAVLALKSGNAVVLRGGREAFRSNQAIVNAIHHGLEDAGLPPELVGFIEDTDHRSADEIMNAVGLVDMLIPRGGAGLIRRCVENALVPCIHTGTGICHVYVDAAADQEKALNIIENAKTSRPSVCNAEEALLVHRDVAESFLPKLKERLVDQRVDRGLVPVELRLDKRAAAIIDGTPAGELDFDTEFLDYILAVAVVDDVDAAIEHIGLHSTGHSESIITEDPEAAAKFTSLVDSAAVYVNVSTRFTDGGEFGLGCEMGISTQKLHARGPMGLEELNTYKYIIRGDGQIR
ncbi:MAG: glutamate-5-semialdehyde dehydrogenase [Clostridiales bacterium]|nr:glutamate-5-semialdehyde dehydrogenase [Clostridiales bacterium]